ncbi:hypothetical protein GAQ89_001700 [Escherichia coli]|nr:hypothetical protein [Escherichia coli]
MDYQLLIAVYAVLLFINFLLFGLQRTALLIDREYQPDSIEGMVYPHVRSVLPLWLNFARLFFIAKLAILGLFLYEKQWLIFVALVATDTILGMILPIPYKTYTKYLYKRALLYQDKKHDSEPLTAIRGSKYYG